MTKTLLTTGEVAAKYDAPQWLIRRIADELAPPPMRAGNYRLVPSSQLPDIEKALHLAGYLEPEEAVS